MQKKMKNMILTALSMAAILTAASGATACTRGKNGPFNDSLSSSAPSDDSSTSIDSANGTSDGDSVGSDFPDGSPVYNEEYLAIVDAAYELGYGESMDGAYTLGGRVTKIDAPYTGRYICLTFTVFGRESKPIYCYQLKGDGIETLAIGDEIIVSGNIINYKGMVEFDKSCILLEYVSNAPPIENDPYANMTAEEFYADYTVAISNEDAYYRSLHGFMSGELTVPDQAPTLSAYQPKNGEKLVRNSEMLLSEDGTTYTVVDAYGNEAFKVYRDGAYITLEEVAAYVYAFGTYPANQTTSKNATPASGIWGEYLRLNHTAFSGDTDRYPYEPVLPNISGCGGDLHYYEMDIGTTGTDCDPSYPSALYNDGYYITRGAARIVYGKDDLDGDGVYEIGEFHVFYTYNHYNDFQEYLNYEGGWGEKFGNITGGGTISSTNDYNPTPYVEIYMGELPESSGAAALAYAYYAVDRKKLLRAVIYPSFYTM